MSARHGHLGRLWPSITRHARRFKVSTPVILRRVHDLGGLAHNELRQAYERELERLRPKRKSSGGDFYCIQGLRLGRRFARALVLSAASAAGTERTTSAFL
jgi:hypothetical protein